MNLLIWHTNIYRWIILLCLLACGIPLLAIAEIDSIIARKPVLNPNLSTFPESSFVDYSSRLEAPAGKRGFVTSRDGHFYFADGTRARFFGINLAKDTVFIDKPQIEQLAELFARAGINLVRIHHIDDVSGILDPQQPGNFRAEKLDLVDYWIYQLKKRGIYLCLDLNDYRTFYEAEGVVNGEELGRGAKPYTVFDQRLIELQQEYARRFLVEHINPYTKLAYAEDPAIALLEIYDENGLFIRRDEWTTLREPYKTALHQQWNAWLRYRYGSTTALRAAWTNRSGACALTARESLEQATVTLPDMTLLSNPPQTISNPLQAPVRVSDGALFAYEMQVNYLLVMTDYLHEIGVKIPVTAVGAQDVIPDLKATAAITDYIGINYYWDHPSFNVGNIWRLPAYFYLYNPLGDNAAYSFPVTTSLARMHGKPLVVREMGYCYPNPYRGIGAIEAAAYGAFLDIDALILFTYDAGVSGRSIGFFDIHLDPLRWGLISQASRLFLSGEVLPSGWSVGIGSSDVDAFTWKNYNSPLYQLAFYTRVTNYTNTAMPHPFSLLISSGRSLGSTWSGKRLLLFANQRHTDLHYQGVAEGMDVLHGYRLPTGKEGTYNFAFQGFGFPSGTSKSIFTRQTFATADLTARDLQPIATSGTSALGFIDSQRQIICFRNLQEQTAVRMAVDALRDWDNAPISHLDIERGRLRSDTGQIERNVAAKVLRIDTPSMQALAGNFDNASLLETKSLKLSTPSALGTLTAESYDGNPLAESKHFLVKMTTRATNTGMVLFPAKDGPKPNKLTAIGVAPILTEGKISSSPTRVEMNGKLLLEMNLQNGSWEYLVEGNRSLLYVDTPNITVTLPTQATLVRWYLDDHEVEMVPSDNTFTVPKGVLFTEILWEK